MGQTRFSFKGEELFEGRDGAKDAHQPAALDRLLDPEYEAVALNTLQKLPRRWAELRLELR